MERRKQAAVDRKVMKVVVEAHPLRAAPIPPCSISSIAVTKGNEDGSVLVYLGTDTGHILLFVWKPPPPASHQSPQSRIRPLRNSPSRNAQPSPTTSRLSPSPSRIPTSPRSAQVDFAQTQVPSAAKVRSSSVGSDIDRESLIDMVESTVLPDSLASSELKTELKLSAQRHMERGSVESLCVLANASQVAVLLNGQVFLVNSLSLALLGRLPHVKGTSAITCGICFEGNFIPSATNPKAVEAPKKLDERAHLAVAMRSKILLFEVLSWQQEKENQISFVPNSSANPFIIKEITGVEGVLTMAWVKNSVFVGSRHEYRLFSLLDGQATQLFSFPLEHPCQPLIKPLAKDLQVLLVIDIAGILVNAQGQPVAGSLVFSGIPDAVGQSSPYAMVVNNGVVDIFHCKTGSKVQSLAFGPVSMGPCLVADDNENTVVIANADKISCFVQVSVDEQLRELLKQKEYTEAVKLAKECLIDGVEDSGKTRAAIVHAEAGFLLLSDLRFKEAIDHFLQSEMVEPSELFPFFASLSSRWRNMVPRKRYWGLHPPPQPIHRVIENGLFAMQNGLLVSLNNDSKKTQPAVVGDAPNRSALLNKYLLDAIQNFIRYWEITRTRNLSSSMKEGVDTLLLKLYIEMGASEQLELLAKSSNFCLLEEVEDLLRSSGQLRTLAFLYESKNMLGSALEVWQTTSSTDASSDIAAAAEAARLLETCSDSILVLQHIHWIIKLDEMMALRILTSSNRKEPLPADDVLRLLKLDGTLIHQRYLQWLIEDQGSEDGHFHTELARSLAESALRTDLEHEDDNTGNIRQILQAFLEKSNKYDAAAVLSLIADTNLWREQAILHMKQGNEVLALNILALKLEDSEAAEKYCAELGRPDAYVQLLDMYLKPGGNTEPMYSAAVRLLYRHGAALDPLQVLEALPPDMPLHIACQALVRILRARVHCHRQGQIAKNLTRSVNFQTRMERLDERSREIQITSETVCSSCRARIGTKLFAVYPDDSVVCYKCLRLRGE